MKVAIFSTHPTFVTHFESELEIAQKLLNNGVKVDFYLCNDKRIKCCDNVIAVKYINNSGYHESSSWVCDFCINRQSVGLKLLDGSVNHHFLINEEELKKDYFFDSSYLADQEVFKSLYYDDVFDVGWSILSSLISYTRDPFVNLVDYKSVIINLYNDSIRVYETAKKSILLNQYDRIYLFNGRLSYTRGLYRLGQKYGVETIVHERGSTPDKYELFVNTTPHNIDDFYIRVNQYWKKSNVFYRYFIGKKFFINKINGFSGSWESFSKNFSKNKLPDGFNKSFNNIVVFTSSEDEFVSIDSSWKNPFFKSQVEGLDFLCKEISKNNNQYKLYIRIHPNSKNIKDYYLKLIYDLKKYNNVVIIPPDSTINSYSLLFEADKVITFGSTMTIEAVFWRKPVILLGKGLYYNFKGPIIPENLNQIKELLFSNDMPKVTRLDAIKIGYYFRVFGIPYEYYKSLDYKSGFFKGVNVTNGEVIYTKESYFRYIFNIIKGVLYKLLVTLSRNNIDNN